MILNCFNILELTGMKVKYVLRKEASAKTKCHLRISRLRFFKSKVYGRCFIQINTKTAIRLCGHYIRCRCRKMVELYENLFLKAIFIVVSKM